MRADRANSHMCGCTNGTEDKVSEHCFCVLLKPRLSLAGACGSFWRHTAFQAPGFYERMGYERKYAIEVLPKGHADIICVKVLQGLIRARP